MGRLVSILALVLAGAVCLPGGAQAAFGVNDFDITFTSMDGTPATQAGSHPFTMTTSLAMNAGGEEPEGRLRELLLEEIPGLVSDTVAYPRCLAVDFNTLEDGVNDCPQATAVGISAGPFGEPDNLIAAPVFNLVPPPGALMRLGFRVGDSTNVVADFELGQEPPYNVVAIIGDVAEAIELFGLELQIWGDPANPAHDEFRGICVVHGGSCPVPSVPRPFLTLPTSCKGPQATFYEAISWEGDEDFGSVLSHDGADDPQGFTGCGKLVFGPQASTALTTEEAQSPAGLDISIDTIDEGLTSVAGRAQSDIREVLVALPEGMTVGPSLTTSSGGCSEADVEAETPESTPGEGCPASSEVGAAEVESPLVEGQLIHGTVYRATPNENFAGSPMALYVVLKDADLGVVIVQPVALETDPDTGGLFAVAEEMPQLPFSHLRLHLDDGKGGPLISPPRCGKYETETEFDPWAGGTFTTLSTFQLSSGPNGGPCPTGADESHADSGPPSGSSPPAASAPVVLRPPPLLHRHRCRKGRHRVRRHGKTRCVAERHRKHRAHAR